jgi:serine/threonine protein kinase/tetratricopeptide (TPR) repeat protein
VNDTLDVVERLADQLARGWRAGRRPRVEEVLAPLPALAGRADVVLELLAEEVRLREEAGEPPDADELLRRFPRWPEQVRLLLECHRLLAGAAGPASFPAAGETLGDFRLLAELGRGAHGVAYLAAQASLADRPVVLKLGPALGAEHLSLSRLQHTHIVPLHSVHDLPDRGLRGLCQPYFGGATLSRLLWALGATPPAARSGLDLLSALDEAAAAPAPPATGPARRFLARATYVQAVSWVGACLADALQYAHERGLLHLDLKPSNVLLAADGTPMLLDFHLARAPLPAGAAAPPDLGGTPGYMAREHLAALAAACDGRPLPAAVGAAADVYSVGVLLYEALGGDVPPPARSPGRALRRRNPAVTPGLADVLARCLAEAPADRYAAAAGLADDLRRHLADLPLRGVANRSPVERWRKWRRRRPAALAVAVLLLAGLAAVGSLLTDLARRSRHAEAALREGEGALGGRRYRQAADAFRHGGELAEGLLFHDDLRRRLREGAGRAERGQAARELHALCERLRPLYGAADLPDAEARALAADCLELWRRRGLFADGLDEPGQEQLRADLLDLAVLWADLRAGRAGPGEAHAARAEALKMLNEAEALLGPGCVLARERRDHARALGRAAPDTPAAPRTAWEHYALGRAALRAGALADAAEHLDRAVRLRPEGLWPNFHLGLCASRLGRHEDALVAFSACVALAPDSAACVYNRGRAFAALGRLDRALEDYDRALRLAPALAAAYLSRAHLRCRQGRFDEALADLALARRHGAAEADASYHEGLVCVGRGDEAAAVACLERALRLSPGHEAARLLLATLRRAP